MRVALITGSYPPDACGVGDYCYRLTEALTKQGVQVEVVTGRKWGLLHAPALAGEISRMGPDVIHLQYPTVREGFPLGPQGLAMMRPLLVTMHEFSLAHPLRKLSLYPYLLRNRMLVFTSQAELDSAAGWAPWIRRRCEIIPIATNILPVSEDTTRDLDPVVYFGLLRPHKGLEEVIDVARLSHQNGAGLKLRIMGHVDARYPDYVARLRDETASLPIEWNIGLSDSEVSQTLGRSRLGYLPFPDGASERRGSLLALLASGVCTVTTRGAHTPKALDRAVRFSDNATEAFALLRALAEDDDSRKTLSRSARAYADNFTWESIAARHLEIYEMLSRSRQG